MHRATVRGVIVSCHKRKATLPWQTLETPLKTVSVVSNSLSMRRCRHHQASASSDPQGSRWKGKWRGASGSNAQSIRLIAVGALAGGLVASACLYMKNMNTNEEANTDLVTASVANRTWNSLKSPMVLQGSVSVSRAQAPGVVEENEALREKRSSSVSEEDVNKVVTVRKKDQDAKWALDDKVKECRKLLQHLKEETGAPGLSICVSVDGKVVLSEGTGFADLENGTPCHKDTVMRIASISKSITAAIVGRLVEEGKLDLDLPVQHYVPEFPQKTWEGKPVVITPRLLLTHQSGIRHYDKPNGSDVGNNKKYSTEMDLKEYYVMEYYDSVSKALDMFKDCELAHEPGTKYKYSTHGYTLLSAAAEKASGKTYPELVHELTTELGMRQTTIDCNKRIIYDRARFYYRSRSGRLVNAPYVDCSYKWAGGGLLSSPPDIVTFGNAMLYSLQKDPTDEVFPPGLLSRGTMLSMLTPTVSETPIWSRKGGYGHGWQVATPGQLVGGVKSRELNFSHSGGAVGSSSVLVVLPTVQPKETSDSSGQKAVTKETTPSYHLWADNGNHGELTNDGRPQGVVVAVVANLTGVGLYRAAMKIAEIFQNEKGPVAGIF